MNTCNKLTVVNRFHKRIISNNKNWHPGDMVKIICGPCVYSESNGLECQSNPMCEIIAIDYISNYIPVTTTTTTTTTTTPTLIGVYNDNKTIMSMGSSAGIFVEPFTAKFWNLNSNGTYEVNEENVPVTIINAYKAQVSFPGKIKNYTNGVRSGLMQILSNYCQTAIMPLTYGNSSASNVPTYQTVTVSSTSDESNAPYCWGGIEVIIPSVGSTYTASQPTWTISSSNSECIFHTKGALNFRGITDQTSNVDFRIYIGVGTSQSSKYYLSYVVYEWYNQNNQYRYYIDDMNLAQPTQGEDNTQPALYYFNSTCSFNSSDDSKTGATGGTNLVITPYTQVGAPLTNIVYYTITS